MKQYAAIVNDKEVHWKCCPYCSMTKVMKEVDGVVTFLDNCNCKDDFKEKK